MATTPWQAFNEFQDKILPTSAQNSKLSTKRTATHNYLLEGFNDKSDMPLLSTTLIGSAKRRTMIRPVDDIDVMAVFSDEYNAYEKMYISDSQAFLQRIRRVLGEGCTVTVGARGQAVRLFYQDNVSVDIAPVFRNGDGGYLLPSGDGGWIRTDPLAQEDWFDKEAVKLNNHLRPLIRLLKRWSNVHSKHFKSYHLEVVVANCFGSIGSDYRDAAAKFFLWAPQFLDSNDPAGYGGNLASYLTFAERQALLQRLANAAERARAAVEAEVRGDYQEAIRLWKIEFGGEFPSYG